MAESDSDIKQFVEEAKRADEVVKQRLSLVGGTNMCYSEGVHWLAHRTGGTRGGKVRRLFTDYEPSSRGLRTIDNDLTRLQIKAAAATYPSRAMVDVMPLGGEAGIAEMGRAKTLEEAINAMVSATGLLQAWRDANHRRTMWGVYGIGLCLENRTLEIDGEQVPDQMMRAFAFEPTHLILDPGNQDRCLRGHEYVIYHDAMTRQKIKRVYGIDLDPDKLLTIGQLTSIKQEFHNLSSHRLYGDYATHAKTKGAMVYEVYRKDESGRRFGTRDIVIETSEDKIVVEQEDNTSPFGGDGLPLIELRSHRRGDSRWDMSDVDLLREDQDKRNLLDTMMTRILWHFAHHKMIIDPRFFGRGSADQSEIARRINNAVGGLIIGDTQHVTKERPASPPQIMQYPQPPAILESLKAERSEQMREKVFRSDSHFGQTKSHVPDSTSERATNAADDVMAIRVSEDVASAEKLIEVMLGTTVLLARDRSPGVLGRLVQAGFGPDEMRGVLATDPHDMGVTIRVREQSVRFRSPNDRRRDIEGARDRGDISEAEYRQLLAGDLDTPLGVGDSAMVRDARIAAERIIMGEQWEPAPLGEWTGFYTTAFRQALADPRAKADPEARSRLVAAIDAQEQFTAQRTVMLDPQVILSQMQAQSEQQADPEAQQAEQDAMDLAQAIQSSPAVSGQPQQVMAG